MEGIAGTVQVKDGASAVFTSITRAINVCTSSFYGFQSAASSGMNVGNIVSASGAYAGVHQVVESITEEIYTAQNAQEDLNNSVSSGQNAVEGMFGKLQSLVETNVSPQGFGKLVSMSDEYAQMSARIGTMNKELGNADELQGMLYDSALRSRTAYATTVDVVSQFALGAGDVFANNSETVLFAENLNKMFQIAGISQANMSATAAQLAQALATGSVSGEALGSMFKDTPGIMEQMAKSLGVSTEELRNMEVPAEMVKNSLLIPTNDINKQFDDLPMTWSGIWTSACTKGYQAAQPLLGLISGIADQWDTLRPIVTGLAIVVGAYAVALGICKVAQVASGVAQAFHTAMTGGMTAATAGAATAQGGLNAALLACPIVWIVLGIILLIAAIYLVIAAYNHFTESSISATGAIVGFLFAAFAVIQNLIFGFMELVLGIVNFLVNPFIVFANFFANVFKNPISSVIYLFQGLADNVLGVIERIASAMDFVFHSNMAETVAGWRSGLKQMADDAVDKYAPNENYENVMEAADFGLGDMGIERKNYGEQYDKGYEKGKGFDEWLGNIPDLTFEQDESDISSAMGNDDGGVSDNIANIADNTGRTADSSEITSEDLKYMKDIAEREVIDRTVFSAISVDMGGVNNTVNNMSDLNGVCQYLADTLQETMCVTAEGVH